MNKEKSTQTLAVINRITGFEGWDTCWLMFAVKLAEIVEGNRRQVRIKLVCAVVGWHNELAQQVDWLG